MSQLSTYVYPGARVFVTQEVLRASTPNGQFEKLEPKVKEGLTRLAADLESNREISIIEGERESVFFFPAGTLSINKVKAFAESKFGERIFSSDSSPYNRRMESYFDLTIAELLTSELMKNI
jgi:hypothetical protein